MWYFALRHVVNDSNNTKSGMSPVLLFLSFYFAYVFSSFKQLCTLYFFCLLRGGRFRGCEKPRERRKRKTCTRSSFHPPQQDNHRYIDHFGEGCFVFLSHYAAGVLTSCGGGGGGGGSGGCDGGGGSVSAAFPQILLLLGPIPFLYPGLKT